MTESDPSSDETIAPFARQDDADDPSPESPDAADTDDGWVPL